MVEHLSDLTDADARADGFDSAPEMLAMLKSLYPHQAGDGRTWFRVGFRMEQAKMSKAREAKSGR